MSPFNIKERFQSYKEPLEGLSYAFHFLWQAIRSGRKVGTSFRDDAFAEWYKELGHHFADFEATTAVPELLSTTSGIVLELGPGTGNQLPRYPAGKITHIYGVEPNIAFAAPLRAQIEKSGLGEKYTLIVCGIEDGDVLEKHGVVESSVDCVVSMQVLCSLKKKGPEAMGRVWKVLKPGGMFVFWEHTESRDWLTRMVQKVWNILWPFAIGGCRLDYPTMDVVLKSGDWEVVELGSDGEPWSIMPRVWGRLRKVARGRGEGV